MPDDALLSQNMTYSFTKQPLEIISEIFKNGISTTVTQTNSYNKHNDKIETMTLKVGNVTRTVSSYSYNDISRLLSIKRSGNVLRGYDFAYDGLNRLEESTYSEGAGMSQNKNRYSENILSYSANGSIKRLHRYGKKNNGTFGLIDDLTYSYNGNQIKAISDKAGSLLYNGSFDFTDGANADVEYFYDANGALVKDLNKGISNIEYDVLGNLKCITFSNGFKTKYVYDAAGNKLRTTHESAVTNTTDYVGNFVFEDGKLDKYLFDGGYCSFDNNQNPTFLYYEKDHLGSVRMVVNEKGTIEQVNHYYPFGGVYGDLSYNAEIQKSKYIGKEFDHMYGLDWYDHGARMYDAAGLFWDRKDPLFSKYYSLSPYLYCGNNPVLYLDIDGLDWYQENGLYLYSPDVHSGKDLKKGQIYMGSSFTTGKGSNLATYNNDGSVMFANETQAYNYIWQKANYKKREVGGFLLQNNKVLVLPDYKNDASTTKLNAYEGYSFQGRILSNKLGRYTVKAQIHSHQNRFTSAEPSYYVGNTYGDAGLSKNHFGMPVFVMGHDNVLYLIRGVKSNHVVEVYPLNWGQKSLGKLLKGNIKLSKEIFKLKPIIK